MKVRYRYLERDPSLKKNNKELSSFILKGKFLDEKIKNSFENRIKKYLNSKYFISTSDHAIRYEMQRMVDRINQLEKRRNMGRWK